MILETMLALQVLTHNPSEISFTCPDHSRDTAHEVDIVDENGAVIQTLQIGDPPEVNGEVIVTVNVQPIAFGLYQFVVRAVADTVKSLNSEPSEFFVRSPGKPTNIKVR